MTKSKGIGRGGNRPGAGRKPDPEGGETVMFSLSYNREDTAKLKRAWQHEAPNTEFKEWLKAISKSAPLEYAYKVLGFYEEED